MPSQTVIHDFLNAAADAARAGTLVSLALRGYRGAEPALKSLDIRPIIVKREAKLSVTYHYKTRDVVKNYAHSECMRMLTNWLGEVASAALKATDGDVLMEIAPNGKAKLTRRAASITSCPSLTHDRAKQRLVTSENKPYLHALGITDVHGKVLAAAQDKFRQINKYVEILDGLTQPLAPAQLTRIVDMGAGKGYLTFALYDHLANTRGRAVEVVGVEARADLVALCSRIAAESGFTGLRFVEGHIADYDCTGADIVIALHACDTATDDALFKAIRAGAEIIVAAPCCHKQIRREMEKAKVENGLNFLTRHGTLLERQAEMVTDGLRAELLEYEGYATKLFEFISDAHTPKNVMLVATKQRGKTKHSEAQLARIHDAKAQFGITTHHLAQALGLEKTS